MQLAPRLMLQWFKSHFYPRIMSSCITEDAAAMDEALDVFENINNKYEAGNGASTIWKVMLRWAIRTITDNDRGFNDLWDYYQKFSRFEDVMGSTGNRYRDHTMHVVWVMILGLYIKSNAGLNDIFSVLHFASLRYDTDSDPNNATFKQKVDDYYSIPRNKEKEVATWCLTALTHDLGYPLEKSVRANDTIFDVLSPFGRMQKTTLGYDFGIVQHELISMLMRFTSIGAVLTGNRYWFYDAGGTRIDMTASLEVFDHGVVSAYLVLRCLDDICYYVPNIDYFNHASPYTLDQTDRLIDLMRYSEILFSIASHTNHRAHYSVINFLPSFLFLCDELEEFSRYTFESNTGWKHSAWSVNFDIFPPSNGNINCVDISIKFVAPPSTPISELKKIAISKAHRLHNFFDIINAPDQEIVSYPHGRCVSTINLEVRSSRDDCILRYSKNVDTASLSCDYSASRTACVSCSALQFVQTTNSRVLSDYLHEKGKK